MGHKTTKEIIKYVYLNEMKTVNAIIAYEVETHSVKSSSKTHQIST